MFRLPDCHSMVDTGNWKLSILQKFPNMEIFPEELNKLFRNVSSKGRFPKVHLLLFGRFPEI